ncbi:DeoR/GlpR family DNA-binding transcription regulator [Labrys monachus]|nr:DeoR/GlpR family DNA-binding transcription regulator [Labrys monachus]
MANTDSPNGATPEVESNSNTLPALRQSRLVALLQERGQATVAELVALFDVSRDTIRRDLDLLEQRGLLVRTHGGAVDNSSLVQVDTTLGLRMDAHVEAKRRIGVAAAKLVRDSETLIVNGGSTTCYFAAALGERRNLTVVTNNLRLPPIMPEACVRSIHILGGLYWGTSQVTIGTVGFPSVTGISVDTAVIGATGLSPGGLSVARLEEAAEAVSMMGVAKRTIALIDSSKFNVSAFATVTSFDRIHHLVTDREPPDDIGAALSRAGVQVLVCPA